MPRPPRLTTSTTPRSMSDCTPRIAWRREIPPRSAIDPCDTLAVPSGLVSRAKCHNISNTWNATRWQVPPHPEHSNRTYAPPSINGAEHELAFDYSQNGLCLIRCPTSLING